MFALFWQTMNVKHFYLVVGIKRNKFRVNSPYNLGHTGKASVDMHLQALSTEKEEEIPD
jgi:hypothetical protein